MLVQFFDYVLIVVCFFVALVIGYAVFKLLENTMRDFVAVLVAIVIFGVAMVGLATMGDTTPAVMTIRGEAAARDAVSMAKRQLHSRPFDECARQVAIRNSHLASDTLAAKIVSTCR